MKCTKCGAQLEPGMQTCPLCGAPGEGAESLEQTAVETPVEETAAGTPAEESTAEPTAQTVEEPVEQPTVEPAAEAAGETDAQPPETAAEATDAQPVEGFAGESFEKTADTPAGDAPAKKQTGRVALFAAVAVLAVAVLVFAVTSLGKKDNGAENPADATGETTSENAALNTTNETDPTAMNNVDQAGNFIEHSYTVANDAFTEEDAAAVVATCGDAQLTNSRLSYYYWQQYYNFMSIYGSYASMMGLDTTKPLSEQMYDDTHTWEDFFLQSAVRTFWQTEAINAAAEEVGYVLDSETEDYLASLTDAMTQEAEAGEYASVDEYIQAAYGPHSTMDSYTAFAREMMTASGYLSTVYGSIELTDDEISAYFDENAANYAAQNIAKDDPNMVNVRHILITPQADENAETDENGQPVLTEQNWTNAQMKADEIYKMWQEGDATEETFAALATEYTEDPGSMSTGGLYEEVYPGQMVQEFNDWCFDAARQVGETGIVKTSYGYHIMYFSGVCDHPYWYKVAQGDCLTARQQQALADIVNATTVEVDYSKAKLTENGLL